MADKNTIFHQKLTLNVQGTLLDLSGPKVMGILNVTPDSFYDGGRNNDQEAALKRTTQMLSEGADIIDVGAYSSRPGAVHISREEELERLIPVVKILVKNHPGIILSVDTFRAEVARAAIGEGAGIINDISGGEMDPDMFSTMAELKVPYVLMHMKGTPQTMVNNTSYSELLPDICRFFIERICRLRGLGISDIIVDPGFGFAKTSDQSFELLSKLDQLKICGQPILAALSRKSMIYKTIHSDAEHALSGTIAANTVALMKGANILRVHDVKAAKEVIQITDRVLGPS